MGDQRGRVAVVTGGASGIGRACAERLASDGASVAVLDLDADAATSTAASLGGEARHLAVTADVSDRAAVDGAFARVRSELGPVAVLVNAAGRDLFRAFLEIDVDQWRRILEINLTGTFHCCQAALPDMVDAGWGRIVNISSSSTHGGQPYMAPYVAAKSGVNGLTKTLALEFGPAGVTVNAIPPGFIDTPMLRAAEARGLLGGTVAEHEARTPVRRVGRPGDIAAMCAFLASDEAGYVTGQIIGVNGGRNT